MGIIRKLRELNVPPPRLIAHENDEWYVDMCVHNPAFDLFWWQNTQLVYELRIRRGLVAIDADLVRPTVKKTGQVVAYCFDPDQANAVGPLVVEKFNTARIAPLTGAAGGPRFWPESRFNRKYSYAAPWLDDVHLAMDPSRGKAVQDLLPLCHVPCLGAFHADRAWVLILIWELMKAKDHLHESVPVKRHAIDLGVQIDFRDTRKRDLDLIDERVMRQIIEQEVADGDLDLELNLVPA